MRTECRGGVEMRIYHRPLPRDRDAPRAPLASPERLDGLDSPELPERLDGLESREPRDDPDSLASLDTPASRGLRGSLAGPEPHVMTYSPRRHATPGDEEGLRSPRRSQEPSRRPTRRAAKLRPRAGIHARAMPYAPTPTAETRRYTRRQRDTRPSASASADPGSMLYPLCEQPSAHLQTLPLEHRPLFRVIVEASRESSQKGDAPPSRRTGARLHRELKLAHNQWLRANRESPIWPWRTAAMNFVSALAPRLQTHRHMHDLLMTCAFWCCLAHAATCSCAGLYSTHCRHLFRAFGCGGPASIVAST
ncbi:virion protein US10 [Macacine alphaherpesvirus 1]|uniref:Virion protein US10 n=1 Tax=Macacine alphaherpesvirus 2 TaxID=2845554 RepID=A0A1X9WF57_9ALPH|nr:virion protein US10 [Macacine alphaherpesvirus 1]ARS01707.1 virion protein US10 [Macacine alphaherpesvirus 2]